MLTAVMVSDQIGTMKTRHTMVEHGSEAVESMHSISDADLLAIWDKIPMIRVVSRSM